jgi:hypothetical protein
MAPTATGTFLLSSLPEEVIELIAAECTEHIPALRATCRELNHKTWHVFSKTFFSTRNVWIDPRSLDALQQVTQHERLAKCVKELKIYLFEWDPRLEPRALPPGHDSIDQARRDQRRLATKRAKEQAALLRDGQVARQFGSSVSKLPNLQELCIESILDEKELLPNSGLKQLDQSQFKQTYLKHGGFGEEVWDAAVDAIAHGQTKLTRLDAQVLLSIGSIVGMTASKVQNLSAPLATLDRLILNLDVCYPGSRRKPWDKALTRFLISCPNLSQLDLCFGDEEDVFINRMEHVREESFTSLATWPTYPKLKWLSLQLMAVKPEALHEFVQRHRSTLGHVLLENIYLDGQVDGWQPILKSFEGAPALKLITLSVSTNEDMVNILDAHGEQVQITIKDVLANGPHKDKEDEKENDWTDDDGLEYVDYEDYEDYEDFGFHDEYSDDDLEY